MEVNLHHNQIPHPTMVDCGDRRSLLILWFLVDPQFLQAEDFSLVSDESEQTAAGPFPLLILLKESVVRCILIQALACFLRTTHAVSNRRIRESAIVVIVTPLLIWLFQ